MRPHADPSWTTYPETMLEIHAHRLLRVDLRATVLPELAAQLRGLGLGQSWAVITAHNPHGRRATDHENDVRERDLRAVLGGLGVACLRADGISPDGRHREVGIAAAIDRTEAVTLAKRFGQSAVSWYDGSAFWLVPALLGDAPVRLPRGSGSL